MQDQVLCAHPTGQRAIDLHPHAAHRAHEEALRGQRVLHVRRADAKGQRGERAMGAGVRVAGHHGHAGQRSPCSGPTTWMNALACIVQFKVGDANLAEVLAQLLNLLARQRVAMLSALARWASVVGTL
ncbi:hypothetical protein ABID97_003725 [Variovorax sp. OAS795]